MKIFSSSRSPTSSPPPSSRASPSPSSTHHHHHHTFSESLIEENMEFAEAMINKWNLDTSDFTKMCYLFTDNRREANEFLKSVQDLQSAMHFYLSNYTTSSHNLISAQKLMQIAMKRLEKEFHQILSTNRDHLEPESISTRSSNASAISRTSTSSDLEQDENEVGSEDDGVVSEVDHVTNQAMTDLRAIAECMISAGYGRECVKIYKLMRKSVVEEALYELGVQKITTNQINKLKWEILDVKIKSWVYAVKIAVKSVFTGERILCDYVFSTSDSIRESCFTEITREGATNLFNFAEMVAKGKKSPEKMFRILDLYDAISELWQEIESTFSFESTSSVRALALSCLIRLGDAVRSMLKDFESAIHKDPSKTPVPGGGIHPLTRYVMNYVSFLSDYTGILSDITAELPVPQQSSLPETYFECSNSDDFPTTVIAVRFAWLLLVLLCKLDGKTELYKDVSLSYIFLANNLHYVISKVRSSNLMFLLGEDWILKQEVKVKLYTSNYERMGWSGVMSSLPQEDLKADMSPESTESYFESFSSAFEATYRKQSSRIVTDGKLRDEIKGSIYSKLVPAYKEFYNNHRDKVRKKEGVIRYTPEDVGHYLSSLFQGKGGEGVSVNSSSSSSTPFR